MIAHIRGKIIHLNPTEVIIECGGVGYLIYISLYTYSFIQKKDEVLLHTHLKISEDAHQLFGFYHKQEKEMFLHLMSVSGVGGSTARLMLSSLPPDEIYKTITQSKTYVLESVKGIGKKTAERIVLELKDKLLKQKTLIVANDSNFLPNEKSNITTEQEYQEKSNSQQFDLKNDAVAALSSLGINRTQAENVVQKILASNPPLENLESLIKQSLQSLSGL